ncbi:MAG TPA: hypothetical protein VFI47_31200 [Acidimicrobiales bacterium]|nr:hypothetical protein [Acidimicrobiales bacterium]
MPADRTEVTEVVTGLATFGAPDLPTALADPPGSFGGVGDERWARLRALERAGRFRAEFAAAWANGRCFLDAADGLRGRPPLVVEWKGPQRPPGTDPIPADLRIDHVYLVSCKYNSRIQLNAAPWSIFAPAGAPVQDWYAEVAGDRLQALYELVCFEAGLASELPARCGALTAAQRRKLAASLRPGAWTSPAAAEAYTALSVAVAAASARRWRDALRQESRREATLWRFLRVVAASYFVLGSDGRRLVRARVGSPWDWRQSFRLRRFDVEPAASRQPVVDWVATVDDRAAGEPRTVAGHIEVRWSHGRFKGPPEAKVYLDTPHHQVPGYWPLS